MTQVHFTLNNEEVQSIIEHSVKDDISKKNFNHHFQSTDGRTTNGIYLSLGI